MNIPKSCRRPVLSLLYATKSTFTAPNLCWACALASPVILLTGDHVIQIGQISPSASSTRDLVTRLFERLREFFRKLRHPNHLIDSVINRFITSSVAVDQPKQCTGGAIRIVIRYKDQDAAVCQTTTLRDLSSKVQKTIQPVFTYQSLA